MFECLNNFTARMPYLAPEGGEGGAGTPPEGGEPGGGEPDGNAQKTFTQAEVDKVIAERLARERAKLERDAAAKIAAAKTEAERLAAMSAEQRAEAERTETERKLAEREREITRRELRAQALETLGEKGLPKGLADTLNYTDAQACGASIEAVEKAFRAAVQAGVEERMKGAPPPKGAKDAPAINYAEAAAAAQTAGEYAKAAYYTRLMAQEQQKKG